MRSAVLVGLVAALALRHQRGSEIGQPDVAMPRDFSADDDEACVRENFVAIIGAGPAGLAVAAALLERRIPFLLIERNESAGSSKN